MPRKDNSIRLLRWHGARLAKGDYLRTATTGRLYLVLAVSHTIQPQAIRVMPLNQRHQPPGRARVVATRWRGRGDDPS